MAVDMLHSGLLSMPVPFDARARTMDHPWMQMIYKQCFTVKQYATWLALNHAVFQAERRLIRTLLHRIGGTPRGL